MAASSRLSEE